MAFMITTATLLQLAYRLIGMGDFGMAIMGKVWLLGMGMAMAVYGLNRWLKWPFVGAGLVLGLLVFTGKWHFGLYVLWAIALGGFCFIPCIFPTSSFISLIVLRLNCNFPDSVMVHPELQRVS